MKIERLNVQYYAKDFDIYSLYNLQKLCFFKQQLTILKKIIFYVVTYPSNFKITIFKSLRIANLILSLILDFNKNSQKSNKKANFIVNEKYHKTSG